MQNRTPKSNCRVKDGGGERGMIPLGSYDFSDPKFLKFLIVKDQQNRPLLHYGKCNHGKSIMANETEPDWGPSGAYLTLF